ncbi:MAG: S1 RNA-binding domain-containing protein [Candidatus Nealsonbacteria bacterium]|nr:S1 RNA-binding domain-containing protein [Candidatus Nealsonbacteria bacterium]
MKELLKKNNLLKVPKIDEIVEGKIVAKVRSSVFIDLGVLKTGIIYGKEFYQAKDILKNLKVGDPIFAKIINLENEDGFVELSISQAGEEINWEKLRQKKEKGETLRVKISGANKGGLLADLSGIMAFLPVSQLKSEHYPRVEDGEKAKILRELQKFIGKELEVKIFDLDQKERKLILSEKLKDAQKVKEFLKNYKVGDVVEGEITGIVEFGAFLKFPLDKKVLLEDNPIPPSDGQEERKKIDFLTLEGLIHISELDWKLIEDPSEIVKVGEKVRAKIIEISNNKIFLSLKVFKKNPWQDIEKKYEKGSLIEGKAVKINPFGAFIQISPEIQGLCHISEFANQNKMNEQLKIGEKYQFEILLIKPAEHRIILKLIQGSNEKFN